MTLSYLRRGVSSLAAALTLAPFLMGADGQGCGPGAPFSGGVEDAGTSSTDSSSGGCCTACSPPLGACPPDVGSEGGVSDAMGACTPTDCKGLPPVLPCPSDDTSESSCVREAGGGCGWSDPVCVVSDAGNAPPPDAPVVCSCPTILVAKCPDGSSPPTTTGPAPCHCPEVEPCPAEAGTVSCGSDVDCPTGSACGFPEADACTVTSGQCFPSPGVECNAIALGCACDGTEVNIACNGLPSGYEPKPLRHSGPCTDGG
jgi:hypothetical protein